MGLRGRGEQLARRFVAIPGVDVAYLCDVDSSVVGPSLKAAQVEGRPAPKAVGDFRRILDDRAVDGLVIAAPDHWHAVASIHACRAGKHVYVEKPASHNIVEGRRMVEAARKYDRVVQTGTQRRSSPALAAMGEFLRSGGVGKIHFARAWITSQRENIGRAPDEPTPEGVDYDLWLGPAPERPFNRNHFHYHWHWNWLYGTGELGNNGVHGLDLARWALGLEYPHSVVSSGGKFHFDDDQVTPDTQTVLYDYPGLTLVWEHRTWSPEALEGTRFGVEFHGVEGVVLTNGSTWQVIRDGKEKTPGAAEASTAYEPAHQEDWLDCIRSGRRPSADVETGHVSAALCHLGNISHRLGRKLAWDAQTETFASDSEADAMLSREYRSPWTLP
jgi:predicted dehydrogenase